MHQSATITKALGLLAIVGIAACESAEDGLLTPQASIISQSLVLRDFEVCKTYVGAVGPAVTIDWEVDLERNGFGSADVVGSDVLTDGQCTVVYQYVGLPGSMGTEVQRVTVTEQVPLGYSASYIVTELDGVIVTVDMEMMGNSVTRDMASNDPDNGFSVEFINTEIPRAPGRMTGGGNPQINGVILGLTLHCDITLSNNLEINWAGGNWHLSKPIDAAVCIDDPTIDPAPPAAPFDTFVGEATGRLDGVDGSIVHFEFVDAGEPGSNDTVSITIWAVGDGPGDTPILDVSGNLTRGNLQAHFDQPHGNN